MPCSSFGGMATLPLSMFWMSQPALASSQGGSVSYDKMVAVLERPMRLICCSAGCSLSNLY